MPIALAQSLETRPGARFMGTQPQFENTREAVITILGDRAKVRIWVPRCGAGAEAYEWAAILRRHVAGLVIFATDQNVHANCTGLFTDEEVAPLPAPLRRTVLERAPGGWEISPRLRHHVIRADHTLMRDVPLGKMDLISLCSAGITADEWPGLLGTMRRCLQTGGLLFVGDAPELPPTIDGFSMVGPGLLQRAGPVSEPVPGVQPPHQPTDAALLDLLAPPTLLIDEQDVVQRRVGAVDLFLLSPDAAWPRALDAAVAEPLVQPAQSVITAVRTGEGPTSTRAWGISLSARRITPDLIALNVSTQDQTAMLTAQNARLAAANADLRARLDAALKD